MLYQTHHPFLFQFHPFTCSIPCSSSTTSPSTFHSLSSPPPPIFPPPPQVATEMECVEAAALKTSIWKEMAVKPTPQAVFDDLPWGNGGVNAQNGVTCDDFSVDDLLDFSNEDGFVETEAEEDDKDKVKGFASVSPLKLHQETEKLILCENNELGAEPASELGVPADDLENLEWLSHFVEDSFSEFTSSLPAGFVPLKPKPEKRPDDLETPLPEKPCFRTPVPAKARSKRTRTGGRVWSLGSPSLTESSSSSTSSSTSSSPSSPWLIYTATQSGEPAEPVGPAGSVEKPPKKPKRRLVDGSSSHPPRRCSHCGVQKTPQWRTGPNGAKTLCNACGVRYKSGRLLPEYRPACSPTFSSELHSNHHRKVLEMRRKKDTPVCAEPGLAKPPVMASF